MAQEVIGQRCPRCGCTLITDGKQMWCTFVGGGNERPCTYGIDSRVPLPDGLPSGARSSSLGLKQPRFES